MVATQEAWAVAASMEEVVAAAVGMVVPEVAQLVKGEGEAGRAAATA
jgi:hypothetical protein